MSNMPIPASPEAEKGLLSCLMQSPELASEVAELLDPAWFYVDGHQVLYTAIQDLSAAGKPNPGDLIELTNHLKGAQLMDRVGGPGGLAEILNFTPAPAHWKHYLGILREHATRRQLIMEANRLMIEAYKTNGDISALLSDAEAAIQDVADTYQGSLPGQEDGDHPLKQPLFKVVEELEKRFERHSRKELAGLSTGLIDLDCITHGLQPGRVYLLGARPKHGKSSLLRQILLHVATPKKEGDAQAPVLLHSLEMSREQTVEAMLVREGELDADDLAEGSFHEKHDFPAIMNAANRLSQRKIFVESRPVTIHQFAASARRHRRRHQIKLLALDYIQRLRPHNPREDARANISYASRMLADLAIKLEIPIIVVAQLNREAEGKTAAELHPGYLKECGALEEDASFIGLLGPISKDDEEYDSPVPGQSTGVRTLGLNVVAQRFGTTGLLKFVFRGHHYQFHNHAHDEK